LLDRLIASSTAADLVAKRSSASSYDAAAAARLWQVKADLVGVPIDQVL
jgi:hypothetical protein